LNKIFLLKLGELVLKGLNRKNFEDVLVKNLKRKLEPCGAFKIYASQSIIYVEPDGTAEMDEALELCKKTFGISAIAFAAAVDKDKDAILAAAKQLPEFLTARSFKVETKRADKQFPMTSIELSQYVGGELAEAFPDITVDVHNPELTVKVEIRAENAYLYAEMQGQGIKAGGGLPVGTSGRAVALLSGGIDSPVALWMMARRGLRIIPVHFLSPPYTSELARQKVMDISKILLPWCEKLTVAMVRFTKIQEEIRRSCPERLFTVISRRFMTRIAAQIAEQNGAGSIITGESLGQVASQTQDSLAVTGAVTDLPVLRPLIGMDKVEIVEFARRINTFDVSALPYEDCCTVFTPRHPKTKPRLDEVIEAESALDIDALVAEALAGAEHVHI
jgi:thiamine biosynthesis protein ThiI